MVQPLCFLIEIDTLIFILFFITISSFYLCRILLFVSFHLWEKLQGQGVEAEGLGDGWDWGHDMKFPKNQSIHTKKLRVGEGGERNNINKWIWMRFFDETTSQFIFWSLLYNPSKSFSRLLFCNLSSLLFSSFRFHPSWNLQQRSKTWDQQLSKTVSKRTLLSLWEPSFMIWTQHERFSHSKLHSAQCEEF